MKTKALVLEARRSLHIRVEFTCERKTACPAEFNRANSFASSAPRLTRVQTTDKTCCANEWNIPVRSPTFFAQVTIEPRAFVDKMLKSVVKPTARERVVHLFEGDDSNAVIGIVSHAVKGSDPITLKPSTRDHERRLEDDATVFVASQNVRHDRWRCSIDGRPSRCRKDGHRSPRLGANDDASDTTA